MRTKTSPTASLKNKFESEETMAPHLKLLSELKAGTLDDDLPVGLLRRRARPQPSGDAGLSYGAGGGPAQAAPRHPAMLGLQFID